MLLNQIENFYAAAEGYFIMNEQFSWKKFQFITEVQTAVG